jgi:hypothetical protein
MPQGRGIVEEIRDGGQQLSRAGAPAAFDEQLTLGLLHKILQPDGILLTLRTGAPSSR